MSPNPDQTSRRTALPPAWRRRWVKRVLVLAVLGGMGYAFWPAEKKAAQRGTTFPVKRGPLEIAVLEGGSVEALESQEVKSEVQGQTKILSIVEEGYAVTEEDVKNGKVMVELDSKELVDQQVTQELEYQNAVAAFTEAKEEYDIQLNQNRSDITAAELAAKFARMDLEKYLGAELTRELLTELKMDVTPASGENEAAPAPETASQPAAAVPEETGGGISRAVEATALAELESLAARPTVDFAKYADLARLGDGEARQMLRKLEDAFVLAKKELGLAQTLFEGTLRLAAKDFVTSTELENEKLKVERCQISLEASETEKDLFVKYAFPKMAEKLLSDYEEALRKLERAKRLAVSKLAQADAKRKSTEARYNLQTKRRQELLEQIQKCVIRAERPGLVVYGANDRHWSDDDRIQEGAQVRERQEILTIPDMSQMAVKVKIHESSIKRLEKGQKARIRVDAYPDAPLEGEVVKVAILPDSQDRWMNPDMKVYATMISIEGSHEWLKPGLSAQVEIIVKEIPDVLQVPIQAVTPSDGKKYCFVAGAVANDRREVEVGEFNNEFIEIKSGLKEGEKVLLRAPVVPEDADKQKKTKGEEDKGPRKKREEPPREPAPPPPKPENPA